ncbi:Uncharacterized peptidase C1-like protein F26E4.3 [Eumeta japonica]|uniref:Uncharacterized peptidase C1-like protein F26E4.3 n=1 Tax=Eumeta variegata TaxID=151549 RepID=A0A4C1UG86_EUMVA|nr:Uncharacterized peptidase C1-like protein F26E4.3 [Eumeta japonica]
MHFGAGTLCYCDNFCDRGADDDCCPDYLAVCKGLSLKRPTCSYEGKEYALGNTTMRNCRKCHLPRLGRSRADRGHGRRLSPTRDIVRDRSTINRVLSVFERGTFSSRGNSRRPRRRKNEAKCKEVTIEEAEWFCDDDSVCLMDEDVVRGVGSSGSGWQATVYPQFWGRTLKDGIQYRLGTLPLRPITKNMGSVTYEPGVLPTNFDAREQWPSFVSPVRDQGWCGSDWAVSLATVLADRFAIQSKGELQDELSAQTLLSCNSRGQQGCTGGHIDVAWQFSTRYGLVSEECLPYDINAKACPFPLSANATKMPCGSYGRWSRVYRSGPPSKLSTEEDIKYEIRNWGPVQAIIKVYQDLFHYRAGVYRHTGYGDSNLAGLHSVRVVGWGDDGGRPYWLIANSWGPEWGENGYVRVARDDPATTLEFVVTTLADVAEHYEKRR